MGYHFWEIDQWYEGVMGEQLTPHTSDLRVKVEGCCCTVYLDKTIIAYNVSLHSGVCVDVTGFHMMSPKFKLSKKLLILLSIIFYFHEVLRHLKTLIHINFRFQRVLRFVIEDT